MNGNTSELSSLSLASITANSLPSLSYEWIASPRFSLGCLNHWETNFFISICTQTPFFELTSIFLALTFRLNKNIYFFSDRNSFEKNKSKEMYVFVNKNYCLNYMQKSWRIVSVFRFNNLIDYNPGVCVLQMICRPDIHPKMCFCYVRVEYISREFKVLTLDLWRYI